MERRFAPSWIPLLFVVTGFGCSAPHETNSSANAKQEKSSPQPEVIVATAAIHSEDSSAKATAEKFSEPGDDAPPAPTADKTVQSPAQTPWQNPSQSPVQMTGENPDEDLVGITIEGLKYLGDGCPADSVATNVSPDAKAFTLLFDSFFVETAPEQQIKDAKKSCKVEIEFAAPAGWQVALMSVDYRGFADLGALDQAVLTSKYQFAGSPAFDSFTAIIQGARSDDFQARSDAFLKTANWTGCSAQKFLSIDISTAVTSGAESIASLTLDSVDGEISYKAGLMWKKCN